MTLQSRTTLVLKDKTLSKITVPKLSIWWFFEWLKLALDYEGKTIEFSPSKRSGGGFGVMKNKKKHILKITAWKEIDLKEIKSMKPILNMTDKEKFNYLNNMFLKYRHLFGDFTVRYIKDPKDFVEDKNYFTVQIPTSKNRVDIDAEIEKLRIVNDIKQTEKKTIISFHKPVKTKEMKRMFDIFKFKEFKGEEKLTNEQIASKVKYKKGTYIMAGKTEQIQQGGVRQVQNAYRSAKKLLLNIAKGQFPKTSL
jgi:hypothetical protein